MRLDQPISQIISQVQNMGRRRCIHELLHFDAIPFDFDEAFLESKSDEDLCHMLIAAVVTATRHNNSAA
ncbi:MAG: hypothetical protein ACYTGQ_03625 [Planctomycetota bacterium]|jgi:hypothetical protein